MTRKVYIRTTRVDGKVQEPRELIVDGIKVAELSKLDLLDLIVDATLAVKDSNG